MTERSNPQEGATLDSLVRELAEGPSIAHLATLLRDGSPHSAAVWTAVEGERLVFYKSAASVGLENVRRDPRVAISMVAHDDPYRTCQVRGRVVEFRGEPDASRWLNRRAIDYTGAPYPPKEIPSEGALLVVEVERQRHHSSSIFKDRLPSARS